MENETKDRKPGQRSDVVRCEFCGEDYSVTYKRCPFCDDKALRGGRHAAGGTGGKRLSGSESPVKRKIARLEPVQIIGLVLSLILIAAAVYIVITAIAPLLHRGEGQSASSAPASVSASASASASAPDETDVSVSVPADSSVVTPLVHAAAIRFDVADVTLKAGESFTIKATLTPENCDDEIVWTSSNEEAATVTAGGTVTNVNHGAASVVTITATAGEVSASCIVRCAPAAGTDPIAPAPQPAPTTQPAQPATPASPTAVNKSGAVTGTTTGLLVRSGPGREHEAQDTLLNGTDVTILEDTGTGWYKISYSGNGGRSVTGYAAKDYITAK